MVQPQTFRMLEAHTFTPYVLLESSPPALLTSLLRAAISLSPTLLVFPAWLADHLLL